MDTPKNKDLHYRMLAELSEHISHDLGNLPKLKTKLKGTSLTPADLAPCKTLDDVLEAMRKRGILGVGNYAHLKKALRGDHEDIIEMIEETEKKMGIKVTDENTETVLGHKEKEEFHSIADPKNINQSLHCDLIAEIQEYLSSDLGNLEKFKARLRSKLSPNQLSKNKTFYDIATALESKGLLSIGHYGNLIGALKGDNEDVVEMIRNTEKKMKENKAKLEGKKSEKFSGSSPRKRRRSSVKDSVSEDVVIQDNEPDTRLLRRRSSVKDSGDNHHLTAPTSQQDNKTEQISKRRRSSVKDTNCSNGSDQMAIQVKLLYTKPGKSSNVSRGENFRKLEEAALPYEEIYNIVQQGVCNQIGNIHVTDDGQGTGFRVGSEYIMSAYHVFQPRLDSLWRKLARLVQSKLDKGIDKIKYAKTLCHFFGEEVTGGDKEEMTKTCIKTWRLSKQPNRTFQHLIQLFEEEEHKTLPTEIKKFFEKNSEIGEITFGQFKRKGGREVIFKLDYDVSFYSEADDVILVKLKGIPEAIPTPFFLETTVASNMHLLGHPDDKRLQIDSGCQVYTNYDLMTLKRDIDEAKSKYPSGRNQNRQDTINAYDDVYQRFVEGKHVVFHLSRSIAHGASGSPGIIIEGSKAKVQLMLLAGHPGHVYNTLRKNEIESLPAKCLFESGISMKRVKELLLTEETKSICDDVFKMYEEDMDVD